MIQWYPGHMAKAIKEMEEKSKIVDVIVILLDARIPQSSFNPSFHAVFQNKKILYVLTKKDKADPIETEKWLRIYQNEGKKVVAVDARNLKHAKIIVKEIANLMSEKRQKDLARGIKARPIKTMIVGIPNVGKSTLINALVAKRVTAVGDKPGITKVQQWIKINQDLELLDTPGVLWPKFENDKIGYHLAICGSIQDTILPITDVAVYCVDFLQNYYPKALEKRYQMDLSLYDAHLILEKIAKKKNYYLSNQKYDIEKTALFIIQETRNGYLGRITWDRYQA